MTVTVLDDFADLDIQIGAFEQRYNTAATPFGWKFTRTDLNRLPHRLARHDPASPSPLQRDEPRRINGPDH